MEKTKTNRIELFVDSDRLLCLERAVDILRGAQEHELARLLQIEAECKKKKRKLPANFQKYFEKQMIYWDICVELTCVLETKRKR